MKFKHLSLNTFFISLITASAFGMQSSTSSPTSDRQKTYETIVGYPSSIKSDEIKPIYGTFRFNNEDSKSMMEKINSIQYHTQTKELDIKPIFVQLPNDRQLGTQIAADWKDKRKLTQPIAQAHNNIVQNNWKKTMFGTAVISSGLTSFLLWKTGNLTNVSWEGTKNLVLGLFKKVTENPPAPQ